MGARRWMGSWPVYRQAAERDWLGLGAAVKSEHTKHLAPRVRDADNVVKLGDLVDDVASVMEVPYPELRRQQASIRDGINSEEERFQRTLEQGMEHFERIASMSGRTIPGGDAFKLHDTFGFPFDLTRELADELVAESGHRAELASA